MIYFYKIIEVNDETSQGFMDSLKYAWMKDSEEFYGYIQKNLIGFASDGPAVNMGKRGGLVEILKRFTVNSIFSVHCMAHRLELVIANAFKATEKLKLLEKTMDSTINSIYSFYNDKSHKKNSFKKNCR